MRTGKERAFFKGNSGGTAEEKPFVPVGDGRLNFFRGGIKVKVKIPRKYRPVLDPKKTEKASSKIREIFTGELCREMNLTRVSAPLFVKRGKGLNDDLDGTQEPVCFNPASFTGSEVEIVHSLAKWKRMALREYGFLQGEGLLTEMHAVRKEEELDNLHSLYVDQWDWEKIISANERSLKTLKQAVRKIYQAVLETEKYVTSLYSELNKKLPQQIEFITSQELEDHYPHLEPEKREDKIAQELGAVFIIGIGSSLSSGKPHDYRAPDYDDWSLNGDILFWYPLLETSVEISSMGIRVDGEKLKEQLSVSGCEERMGLKFHREVLEGSLPQSIGGGIGKSRLCMFLLEKAHIGEVQATVWPEETEKICKKHGIRLL